MSTANSKGAVKPKPRIKAPPKAWKPGQSGNPTGRPKDGESWKAILEEVSNMTAAEIASIVGNAKKKELKTLPQDVQMKYLVVSNVLVTLATEPNASLWNSLMDRTEGKVQDRLEVSNLLDVEGLEEVLDQVYGKKE